MCIPPTIMRNASIKSDNSAPTTSKQKGREVKHFRILDCCEIKEKFVFGEKLGNGCFGTVIKAAEKRNSKEWAVKIVNKAQIGTDRFRSIEREIYILKLVSHPHIIYLDRVFESPKKIYLVIEICRGELAETFRKKSRFNEDETRYIIRQLASAVAYLHKNQIVHRDLKLENILIAINPKNHKDDLYIKVTDFGLGIIKSGIGYEDMLHDCCGTLTYMAPEMLSKNYNHQCDIWSMGIIMYLLLGGGFPFFAREESDLMNMIRTDEPSFERFTVCSEAIHLMEKMLAKNPALRISAVEIEHHPWVLNETMKIASPDNVLDMMHLWKSEMMTPIGDECDWIAFPSQATQMNYVKSHASSPLNQANAAFSVASTDDIKLCYESHRAPSVSLFSNSCSDLPTVNVAISKIDDSVFVSTTMPDMKKTPMNRSRTSSASTGSRRSSSISKRMSTAPSQEETSSSSNVMPCTSGGTEVKRSDSHAGVTDDGSLTHLDGERRKPHSKRNAAFSAVGKTTGSKR